MRERHCRDKSSTESDAGPDAAEAREGSIEVMPVDLDDVSAIIRIDAEITGEIKADFWYSHYVRQNTDMSVLLLVARYNGEVAGYVLGSIQAWEFGSSPCGWIEAISVDPKLHRKQIATHLFDAAVAYFLKNGIVTVRTMVHMDSHSLLSFFRMKGMSAGPYIELEMRAD